MKVVVDDKIPYIREAITQIADEVIFAPGCDFTPALVRDADALIIRTRTHCTRRLLEGSNVRFIATATIGFDHIDTEYCAEAGIVWTNAPGCNAASVGQYLRSCIWLIAKERGVSPDQLTLGLVGVGHVGTEVDNMARELGMTVLRCDPPRAEQAASSLDTFVPLSELARKCDVISFHVPLSRKSRHATYHLADASFFASLQRQPMLINTSRGEVVETAAVKQALEEGQISDAILDVWEHEPDIDRSLLQRVMLGTPHIAGYSADGKANATRMSLDALCRFFRIEGRYTIVPPAPLHPHITAADAADAALQMYDPRLDSEVLKRHPDEFERLRGDYPLRREAVAYEVTLRR